MKGSLQLNTVNVQPLSKCTPCTQISRLTAWGKFMLWCSEHIVQHALDGTLHISELLRPQSWVLLKVFFLFLTTACRITSASSQKQHTYCALCTGLISKSHTLWPSCLPLARSVHAARYCRNFKTMHSLMFFHMPCYLDTHQVLLKLSIQYQAILLGYGNSPVSL